MTFVKQRHIMNTDTRKEVKVMYQLKHHVFGEEIQKEDFETLQEVADRMKELAEANIISQILNNQKQYNIRFYVKFKNQTK